MIHLIVSSDILEEFDYYDGMFLGRIECRSDSCARHYFMNELNFQYKSGRQEFARVVAGSLYCAGWSNEEFENYFLEHSFINSSYE